MLNQPWLPKNLTAFVFVTAMLVSTSSSAQITSLQNAVVSQQGSKPVYPFDDMNEQARLHYIKVIGEDGRRSPAATTFTEDERSRFSSIGRTECPKIDKAIATGTAFHVRNYKTLITVAHTFRDPVDNTKLDPATCNVVFYFSDGTVREKIKIKRVRSRWDNPRYNEDASNDIALIELSAESVTTEKTLGIRYRAETEFVIPVIMVGFHGDMPSPTEKRIVRKVNGQAIKAPPGYGHEIAAKRKGEPFSNPENGIVASYDSNYGTSGSPVFNSKYEVIGINQGAYGIPGAEFDIMQSYNFIVRFDALLKYELDQFVAQQTKP